MDNKTTKSEKGLTVIKLDIESLQHAISAFPHLKRILQNYLLEGDNSSKTEELVEELGRDFDTAFAAMLKALTDLLQHENDVTVSSGEMGNLS